MIIIALFVIWAVLFFGTIIGSFALNSIPYRLNRGNYLELKFAELKEHRLLKELGAMRAHFNLNAPNGFYAAIDCASEYDKAYYLKIKFRRGAFSFDDAVARVFPVSAGGEENNIYDILLDAQFASGDKNITSFLQKAILNSGGALGKFYFVGAMKYPHANYIASVNESYRFYPPVLADTAMGG